MGLRKAGIIAAASFIAGSVALQGAAYAAPKGSMTGTIELATSATLKASAGPTYGDYANFATSVSGKISNRGSLYVTVICWQEGMVVYQWSADPTFTFPLVDQSGQNLEWDGGAAACRAELIYRPDFNKSYKEVLDSTFFDVNGYVTA